MQRGGPVADGSCRCHCKTMNHVSLLRGINVSGQKKIKMADLRDLFEQMGFPGARTYIQSGNVVFWAGGQGRLELDAVIRGCPFEELDLSAEGSRVGVVFLSGERPKLRNWGRSKLSELIGA